MPQSILEGYELAQQFLPLLGFLEECMSIDLGINITSENVEHTQALYDKNAQMLVLSVFSHEGLNNSSMAYVGRFSLEPRFTYHILGVGHLSDEFRELLTNSSN